jgi:hypothetical protein
MSLMWRRHQTLTTFYGEGEMQDVGYDADAFTHLPPIPVNDKPIPAAQVFRLMPPELP